MKTKLVKESLTHDFNPSDLFFVCRRDISGINPDFLHEVDTIYTSVNDARPDALFKNSQGYKDGTVNRATEYTYFTVEDLINQLSERK